MTKKRLIWPALTASTIVLGGVQQHAAVEADLDQAAGRLRAAAGSFWPWR